MSTPSLEDLAGRIAALESAMARMQSRTEQAPKKGWETTFGMFHEDAVMKEIMELGKEIRDAEQPDDEP